VVQCGAVCCSVLQCVPLPSTIVRTICSVMQCVAVCCSVLQCIAVCVAVCCSMLQRVAVCCGVVHVYGTFSDFCSVL